MSNERSLLLSLGSYSPYVHLLFYQLFKDDQSLLHQPAKQLKMASLCQTCGDAGFDELLVYCMKCRTSAQHRYCFNTFPKLPGRREDVIWICELCEPSLEKLAAASGRRKHVSSQKLQTCAAHRSQRGVIEGESSQRTSGDGDEHDMGMKMKKRRRLILADEDQFDHEAQYGSSDQGVANKVMKLPAKPVMAVSPPCTNSCEAATGSRIAAPEPSATPSTVHEEAHDDQNPQQPAQPIYEHVWRGHISFGDGKYGPLTSHLSTLACQRVYDAAKSLPPVLHMEKHSRLDSLPNSLKNSPPRDDKIGLFFLPKSTTSEHVVDQLLAEVIRKDLVLKCMLNEVELLMFPSTMLPKENHRFQEKYYLWGAFRRRQVPITSSIADCRITPEDAKEENRRMEVSDKNTRDEGEGLGGEESYPDGSNGSSSFALSPHSVQQHPKSNELSEETRKSDDLSTRAGEKGVGARDEEPQEREEGEIWDKHESSPEGSDGSRFAFSPHSVLQHPKSNELSQETRKPEVLSKHALEKEAVEACEVDGPQEREDGEICDKHEEEEGMDREEREVHEDFNEGHILPFPLAAENMSIASEVGGSQNIEVESHNENPQELEIGQQEAMQHTTDRDELNCLPLFSLVSEDMGVASRIENHRELNLDLGLWWG